MGSSLPLFLPVKNFSRSPVLEQVPQAQLDVPARSVLACDPAELRVRRIGLGVVQVRMVREVEDLRPELEVSGSTGIDVLEQRDVPLILARAVDVVARSVAIRAGRGTREHRL